MRPRDFLRTNLVDKSEIICEATDDRALVRSVRASVLEACGHLPQCGQDRGAQTTDELVSEVAQRLELDANDVGLSRIISCPSTCPIGGCGYVERPAAIIRTAFTT